MKAGDREQATGNIAEVVAQFNAAHPVGTRVFWERDNGTKTEATVRCAAEVLGAQAYVWLVGIGGPKPLSSVSVFPRLTALEQELLDALKQVIPYIEAAEKAGLVGDEGCHWPVEVVRVAIAKAERKR